MTPSLFFIYDPKDGEYLSHIENQLQVLVNNKTLNYWHEGLLPPGVEWRKVRDEKLRSADMVLPIVSANFLASDNCTGLLEEAHKQGKQIVPIIANHCLWDMNDILAKQSPIPKKNNDTEATPISDWKEPTKAYAAIVRAIGNAVNNPPPNPIKNTNMSTNEIKSLIAQGNLKQAIELMPDTDEAILLKARFNKLEYNERMGIISTSDANLERNRITNSLLQMLGKTEDFDIEPSTNLELNNFKQSLHDIIDTQGFAGTPDVFRKIEESAFAYNKSTLVELRNQGIQSLTILAPANFITSVKLFIDSLRNP